MPRLSHGCFFLFKPIGYTKNICFSEEDLKKFSSKLISYSQILYNSLLSLLQKTKFVSSGMSTGMVPSCRWQLWELPNPVMTENPMTRSIICLSDFEELNDPWTARNKRLICKVQPWVCEAFLCTQFQAQLAQHIRLRNCSLFSNF